MDLLDVSLDVIALVVAVGILIYGRRLADIFRGGIFQKAFRIVIAIAFLLLVDEALQLTNTLLFPLSQIELLRGIIEVLIGIAIFLAIYSMYKDCEKLRIDPEVDAHAM
jgi:hypothetical protein